MELLVTLFPNFIPLYVLIGIGWVIGRYLDVNLHSIARINLYVLLPFVTFSAVAKMVFSPAYIALPIILGVLSYALTFLVYGVAKRIWPDGRANLLATATVNGNAIYFGLPVVMALFGPQWVGVYIFLNLGPSMNNITLANFFAARGAFDLRQSLKRVATFPALYGAVIGLVVNISGVDIAHTMIFTTYSQYAAGGLVLLGMMMIGVGLSKLESIEIDWGFVVGACVSKLMLWPGVVFGLITFDKLYFGAFSPQVQALLMLWSSMPVMGNLVAYAAEYDIYPARAACAVLISTVLALVSIPLALWLVGL